MLSYENLDAIADAYTPLIACLSLFRIAGAMYRKAWRTSSSRFLALAAMLLTAYGFMFLDHALGIWPSLGMDYSTHTSVALAFTVFLAVGAKKFRALCWVAFLAYLGLMLYQEYHTLADILTTIAATAAPIGLAATLLIQSKRKPGAGSHGFERK